MLHEYDLLSEVWMKMTEYVHLARIGPVAQCQFNVYVKCKWKTSDEKPDFIIWWKSKSNEKMRKNKKPTNKQTKVTDDRMLNDYENDDKGDNTHKKMHNKNENENRFYKKNRKPVTGDQ